MFLFLVKPPFIYLELIRIGAASCIMSEMCAIILERIWATKQIEVIFKNMTPLKNKLPSL
jgi:hypothetical protein